MSNIEYLRQLHHKNEFEKGSIPRKGLLFLRKGPRFSALRKGLDLHTLRSRKELLIFIDDLNRLAFWENEAQLEHIEILIRLA